MMNGTMIAVLFGEATAQQQRECDTLAASAWGSYLDEDEVLAREAHLRSQPLARDGGSRTWCLYVKDDHDQILSTCKTMRRECMIQDAEGATRVEGYCVTSVFTVLLYRGHGLASYLLKNVTEWLDGPGEASFSMLYSGIPQFYEDLGWTSLPNIEVVLSISTWLQDALDSFAHIEVRTLVDADIEKLYPQDTQHLSRTGDHIEQNVLYVLPTANIIRYQHALSDYMGDLWHYEAPTIRGAACKHDWLYWCHDFRGRCLRIQHVHNSLEDRKDKSDVMVALFLYAVREASEWNFTTISTWDVSADVRTAMETLAKAGTFTKTVSESHRAQRISLRWREGSAKASNTAMNNEAYAWNLRY